MEFTECHRKPFSNISEILQLIAKKSYFLGERSFSENEGSELNNMDDLQIIELYFARDEHAIKETDIKYGKAYPRGGTFG